jgi:formylglycine-generating enzyme required for sulfatase activity
MLPTGLRLPTEAEWEYAYRAGTTTAYHGCPKFPSGTNDPSRIGEIAWYQANSGAETHVVGQKAANALGLHDMAGNVSEWVYDLYGDYASLPTTNPAGPSSGDARGARGGSWGNDALLLRASGRNAAVAPFWSADLGFRVARSAVSVPPAPSQVTPSSGPIAGGTLITITGTNLLGTTSVIVGDAIATSVEVLDAQTIRAVTAPGPAFGGSSSVVVTNQFGVGAGGLFTYTAELPTLSSVAPTSGSNAGGTTITLTGTNLSGATSVMVGGNPATNVTVVSPTSVTAVTPAGAVGPASVSVTTPSGTATLSSGFTYVVPTPTLSSVSPSSGSTAGGTLITLTGTNLLGASSVFVGGTAANNVTVVSSTTVTAVTRPGFPSGPLSVSVTTPAGVAVRPDSFEYIEPAPTLLSVDPAVGGVSGGAIITVKGANLRYVSSVTVGGVPSPSISAIGSNAVRFVVPAGTAGARDIAVTTIGGTATLPGAFTYIAATTGYQVLEFVPDPSIVTLQSLRDEIIATGLPWRILDNQTQIEMVLVPGGTYQMGCTSGFGYPCYSEETPAHTVTISPFYIGRYEITQGQWLRKMGTPPYCQDQGQGEQMFAAHSMSWNSIAGPGGFLSGTALRLPTEAEWEFACRAGSPFAFPYGSPYGVNDSFNPQNPAGQNAIAWYIYNYGQGTPTPVVGSKNPNQYGLHDMTGNVWEWTNDWYAPYTANAQTNPTGPTTGTARVLRGGARNTSVEPNLRCSWRWKLPPDVMPGCFNGFRVARNP